jgi:hypothetical protein
VFPVPKCPLSREYVDKADINLLSICVRHGLGAYEASRRYPASAAKVFAAYGEDQGFQKVFDQYGHPVIPIVAYVVENGSRELQVRQTLGEAFQQVWSGKWPKWQANKITPEQIGLIAIHQISIRGHEMLAEFEIVNGVPKRKPVTAFVLGAKDLLIGGIVDLEKVLVRGERLPSWQEVGLFALDVTIVAGGVGAVAKATRVGSRSVVERSTGRLMVEGAYGAISSVTKLSVSVAPIAFAYILITRPWLIAPAGGWIAEQMGIDRSVGIFAVYLMGFYLLFEFLRRIIWCGWILCSLFRRLLLVFRHWPQRRLRSITLAFANPIPPSPAIPPMNASMAGAHEGQREIG